jgi:serine/threonine-protein kinase ATR
MYQLVAIASHRNKNPYTLISPHLERISILIANFIIENKALVGGALQFLGLTRQSFFDMTLRFTVPIMILERKRDILQEIAGVVKSNLGMMILEHTAAALSKIFLQGATDSLDFLVTTLSHGVTAQSLLTSCIVTLVVSLIIELGDSNPEPAMAGLRRACAIYNPSITDLGAFLQPLMLGIISHLNDSLHDMQGKKTVEYKRKIIRSLGQLFALASMSAFAPQVS